MTKETKKILKDFNGENMLIFPLQYFAEEESKAETEESTSEDSEKKQDNPKTYSQSELDSFVSKAVDKVMKKKDAEYSKLLEKAKKDGIVEGKSYAELTEEQRVEADLEARMKAVEERERAAILKERLTDINADLKLNELPLELADVLVLEEDNEKVTKIIKDLKAFIESSVQEGIKSKLKTTVPKGNNNTTERTDTKSEGTVIAEQFNKKNTINDPFWGK